MGGKQERCNPFEPLSIDQNDAATGIRDDFQASGRGRELDVDVHRLATRRTHATGDGVVESVLHPHHRAPWTYPLIKQRRSTNQFTVQEHSGSVRFRG